MGRIHQEISSLTHVRKANFQDPTLRRVGLEHQMDTIPPRGGDGYCNCGVGTKRGVVRAAVDGGNHAERVAVTMVMGGDSSGGMMVAMVKR